jgi:GNAT superfamily N-acetyltransferase
VQHGRASGPGVRRAGPADAAALVELRAAMFTAMGTDPGGPGAHWRPAAAEWFAVVSGAAAVCESQTPGPWNPGGVRALLFNVCTLPGSEGRGYARTCVAAVMDWVREETTAGTVQLAATAAGSGIYRALGVTDSRYPTMRLSIPR